MASINREIGRKLWTSADQLRANSKLKASEYSVPVLGLIFLRFADYRFRVAEKEISTTASTKNSRQTIGKADYQARGVMYLPEQARYSYLLQLPEGENIGRTVNDILIALLKTFSEIRMDVEGDVFGNIYKCFLGEFARSEGQRGGEFLTPTSLVKLIVEVIEPYKGRILDIITKKIIQFNYPNSLVS